MTLTNSTGLTRASAAGEMIQSRLLILQSKRLMLNSAQRRLDGHGVDEALRRKVEQLRMETEQAQHSYRSTMLAWGSADDSAYWLVAYGKLIEMGQALATKLRDATFQLPVEERYQVSADVETLEGIVDDWTRRMRTSMAAACA